MSLSSGRRRHYRSPVLACDDRGNPDGPAVMFAHGIGSSRRRWAGIVDRLVDDLRCVTVDLPGHGDSPADGCDGVSAAAAVQEVVERLGVATPVVVGHSLGGNTALIHGALFGPRAVVAVDPVPLFLPHLADALAPYADRLEGDDFEAAFHEWEQNTFALRELPSPLATELMSGVVPKQEVVLAYWAGVLRRPAAEATQEQFAAALAAVTVPTLVLLGAEPTPEDAAVLGSMPTTTTEVVGDGHFLHLVDEARFADRLRAWIAALP